jgi:SAM-dependent methyltransferase
MDQFNNEFASHWDELVGWEDRALAETDFLLHLLKKHHSTKILDVALGTGFHSIELLKKGFVVKSLDLSPAMIDIAIQNAKKHNVNLDVICVDWSNLQYKIPETYDCIICLGNSLACEMDSLKREEAVLNWSKLISDDGVIIVDRRNYEALLEGKYNFSAKGQYFGQTVKIRSSISSNQTEFFYEFADGKTFNLHMYPLLENELARLFSKAGLDLVEIYGDRSLSYIGDEVGFYLSVFRKK